MQVTQGRKLVEMSRAELRARTGLYREVMVDVGTGNGQFVYRQARANPGWFCIGLDAVAGNLEKNALRVCRKPARGGLENVLYVIAGVEDLPNELSGIADRIYVNFPWGSLLRGLVEGTAEIIKPVIDLGRNEARLEIWINLSLFVPPVSKAVEGLPVLTPDYIETELRPCYARLGAEMVDSGFVRAAQMKRHPSYWSRRLAFGKLAEAVFLNMRIRKT